jgi:NIMA-interacting peptidyl-prolyl cis-trans isomerase 1
LKGTTSSGEAIKPEKRPREERKDEQPSKNRPEKKSKHGGGSDQIRVRHLLVKHRGSRRPSSWKEPNITRTEDEARKILEGHRARIATGEVKFEDLAAKESDCDSYKRNGDLGLFKRGKMQPPFEAAAFALGIGELSDIVKSESGLHIILRLE